MKIKVCRLCESKKFFNLLNLGKLSYTGKFAKKFSENIPKATVAAEAPVRRPRVLG